MPGGGRGHSKTCLTILSASGRQCPGGTFSALRAVHTDGCLRRPPTPAKMVKATQKGRATSRTSGGCPYRSGGPNMEHKRRV